MSELCLRADWVSTGLEVGGYRANPFIETAIENALFALRLKGIIEGNDIKPDAGAVVELKPSDVFNGSIPFARKYCPAVSKIVTLAFAEVAQKRGCNVQLSIPAPSPVAAGPA